MTLLCGWMSDEREPPVASVVAGMLAALRVHPGQRAGLWTTDGLGVGLLELPGEEASVAEEYAPARSGCGRYSLWLAGEAYAGPLDPVDPVSSRTLPFRERLLELVIDGGVGVLARLDGEFQVVVWDRRDRELTLVTDRHGGISTYVGRGPGGLAFAGGVRGVLMAPGVEARPDVEALREAVSFGGYRLGDRTNLESVKMLPGACALVVRAGGDVSRRRLWSYADVPPADPAPAPALVDRAHALWTAAVRRRLVGAARPGQTLSGGLDSRAILAEAAGAASTWSALTYGIAGCDDADYALRAAEVAGCPWTFYPLYSGRAPDWLERRRGWIQATDGLMQLGDLMHLEPLELHARMVATDFSGYLGDAVCGLTWADVECPEGALERLPYYHAGVGLTREAALERVRMAVQPLGRAAPRFCYFESKALQAIGRPGNTYRAHLRVRRPFADHDLFDFWGGLPTSCRLDLYPTLLRDRYPALFGTIPEQRTGLPVLTPRWRVQLERARRLAYRRALQPLAVGAGLALPERRRSYHEDQRLWNEPAAAARIRRTVLDPAGLCGDVLGRAAVERIMDAWQTGHAPAQVVGALFVYEDYHRALPAHLSAARAAAPVERERAACAAV